MKLIYILPIFFLFAFHVKAQNVDSLKNAVSSLEDSLELKNGEIEKLRLKIEKMEKESRARLIKEKENWRKLERYMTMKEVKKLLGKPESIDKFSMSTRWWYGNGYVDFNAYPAVSGWSEPRKERIEIIEH
ncbi:MAG: hypothetical protein GXO87_01810 [Chlorobi bacterium]|nr:hypothetical protein [Chlorobiota bacterium]